MIAYVAGHTHANAVGFYGGRRGGGFWEINTASHIDWPQQSRLIEVMDNRDGTLSIFGTMLDSAAPRGRAAARRRRSALRTASSSRSAARSPTTTRSARAPRAAATARRSSARRRDRNVELLVRDPR